VYSVEIYEVQITGLEEWNHVPHICIVAQPVKHFFLWLPPFLGFRITVVCKNSLLAVPELSNCIFVNTFLAL
jgi:hypothetical protein